MSEKELKCHRCDQDAGLFFLKLETEEGTNHLFFCSQLHLDMAVEGILAEKTPYPKCNQCDEDVKEAYMLKNELWLTLMPSRRGHLHLKCVEYLLQRKLTLEDLLDKPINLAIRHFYET